MYMMLSSIQQIFVIAFVVTMTTWATLGVAQAIPLLRSPGVPDLHIPPQIRLTGSLHPLEEKGTPVQVVKIFVQDKEWNFWLTQVDTLTGTNYGWLTLADLFPRELKLLGPDELLGLLEKPGIVSKPVTIEGRLYSSVRKLVVTTVTDTTAPTTAP
jgi:hypothetical protein